MTVGTGVIPIQTRHPATLAQQALTVSLISGGRLKLGVGMTHPMISEGMWGVPWNRHVRRLNEFLDGLLPLLRGEEAKAAGELTTTRLTLEVPGASPPPVYVAALGPQLLRVAGRRTAGTITWMTGPRTLADHVIPCLERASETEGRRAEVVAGFPVGVTDEPQELRSFAAEILALYGAQPSYRAMLDREGVAGPADVAIIGDESEVAAQLEALAATGVDEIAVSVVCRTPEEDARTRALLGRLTRSPVTA